MSYFSEFRADWRALAAASVGLAVGYTFTNYVTNIFSPYLIRDLGWAKSDFALLGLIVLVAAVCQPVAGRLADAFGVRRMALVGVIAAPLLFVALSRMNGPFWQFYVINVLQVILVGGTTSAVIYTRLIADRFDRARGVALGIAACAPAVAGALLAPTMSELVEAHGWRTAYLFVAAFVAAAGLLAIALIPGEQAPRGGSVLVAREGVDYGVLLRDRTFQILIAGMLLCNLTLTLQMTQLKIVLLDIGIDAGASSLMISFYGFGVIVGRLFCGVALDRFPPHAVAAIAMAAPAIGLFMLASNALSVPLAGLAIAILGLATGAEGDVGAYLVMRYFRRAIYGSVFGLLMAALSISGALGALLLSYMLAASGGSFQPFLITAGIAAVIGGGLFLLLGTRSLVSEGGDGAPAFHQAGG
jgi:MFS family permease